MNDVLKMAWPTMSLPQLLHVLRERRLEVVLRAGQPIITGCTALLTPDVLQDVKHYRGDLLWELEGNGALERISVEDKARRHELARYYTAFHPRRPNVVWKSGPIGYLALADEAFCWWYDNWCWLNEDDREVFRPLPKAAAWQRLILGVGERARA